MARNSSSDQVLISEILSLQGFYACYKIFWFRKEKHQTQIYLHGGSVPDPNPNPNPDPPDLHVFGPPGSGSVSISSQRYVSESFYQQAKMVRKTLIPTLL